MPDWNRNQLKKIMLGFFTSEQMPEPPKYRESPEPEPEPKPDSKDGWVGKDDFKR